jgi:WD40 repeat protein
MNCVRWTVGALVFGILGAALPARQPPPPPSLPPISPAAAHPDGGAGGLDGPGTAVAVWEDGHILVAACEGETLRYWQKDVAMGLRVGDTPAGELQGHHGPVIGVVPVAGGVVSAGADGKLLFWSLPDGKLLRTVEAGGVIRALAAAPDGALLATAGDDGKVHLWDSAGKAGAVLTGGGDWLLAVAFSPDGKQVAAGGYDGKWHLWETAGKKLLDIPAHGPPPPNMPSPPANVVHAVAFSPDGKLLAAGGADGQVLLFQVADGKLVRALPGHTGAVTALAFHPGGAVLASASKDRTVRLWGVADGQALKTLEGHTSWVQGLAFFARGTRLVSVGADGGVRLWDLVEPKK